MRSPWKRFVSVVVTSVRLAQGAVADSDDFRAFEAADLDAAGLAAVLTEKAAELSRDDDVASKSGSVVVCSRGTPAERAAIASEIDGAVGKAREALKAIGFSVPAKPPKLTYIRVRVTGAPTVVASTADGTALAVREGDNARRIAPPPTPPVRPDGPPLARDAVLAGNRARVWALGAAGGTSAPSPTAVGVAAAVRSIAAARRFLARAAARRSPHPMAMTLTIRRETAGRKGREVTTVAGLAPLGAAKIADLASALKKRCASGGSVEPPGTIVLQGDHRDLVEAELVARGFTVKRAGG